MPYDAMLTTLSISSWSGRMFDATVTDQILTMHGADSNAGRFNKSLIDVKHPSFAAVKKVENLTRNTHYALTLPWMDKNKSLLPGPQYVTYTDAMRDLQDQHRMVVAYLKVDMPNLLADGHRSLGTIAATTAIPDTNTIMDKFRFNYQIDALPSADDFRLTLADTDKIKQDIESRTNQAVTEAVKSLFERIHTAVQHMAEKLGDTDAVFRDSLVENIKDLIDVAPRLNLTNDPAITSLVTRMGELVTNPPEELRTTDVRATVADKAKQIADDMKGLY